MKLNPCTCKIESIHCNYMYLSINSFLAYSSSSVPYYFNDDDDDDYDDDDDDDDDYYYYYYYYNNFKKFERIRCSVTSRVKFTLM